MSSHHSLCPDRPLLLLFDRSLVFLCKINLCDRVHFLVFKRKIYEKRIPNLSPLIVPLIRRHFSTGLSVWFFSPNELSLLVEAILLFLTTIKENIYLIDRKFSIVIFETINILKCILTLTCDLYKYVLWLLIKAMKY